MMGTEIEVIEDILLVDYDSTLNTVVYQYLDAEDLSGPSSKTIYDVKQLISETEKHMYVTVRGSHTIFKTMKYSPKLEIKIIKTKRRFWDRVKYITRPVTEAFVTIRD